MADAKARVLCFVLCVIFFSGTEMFAEDIYTNIWAVKVRGSLQDAKLLCVKHGFSYDKNVSFFRLHCI